MSWFLTNPVLLEPNPDSNPFPSFILFVSFFGDEVVEVSTL